MIRIPLVFMFTHLLRPSLAPAEFSVPGSLHRVHYTLQIEEGRRNI